MEWSFRLVLVVAAVVGFAWADHTLFNQELSSFIAGIVNTLFGGG